MITDGFCPRCFEQYRRLSSPLPQVSPGKGGLLPPAQNHGPRKKRGSWAEEMQKHSVT